MRRTYRSKKGTTGALDHKDVLQNMDERTSAFDAFYIQNLKQTKRELSCVGSSSHAVISSNKVRKRKYVKRLVKEAEPIHQRERLQASVYLTPDKSIRVNKILDPFDLLLNSSPVVQEAPKAEADKTFVQEKEAKTYLRKRKPNIKKFNYSSSSTDSDKENTIDSNATDIRTHQLIVERVVQKCPKNFDESIIKIIGNLSLVNNSKHKSNNGSFNTSYKTRKRLTKNNLSPSMQKSPLCSTPCKEKYRGVSIFKFSPITLKDEMTIEEKNESDHSLILLSNSLTKKSIKDYKVSPLAIPYSSIQNSKNFSSNNTEKKSNITIHQDVRGNGIEVIDNDDDKSSVSSNSEVSSESSCQITEIEPFLGFSNRNVHDLSKKKIESMITSLQDQTTDEVVENELTTNSGEHNDKNHPDYSITNTYISQNQSGSTKSAADLLSKLDDEENQSLVRKSNCNDSVNTVLSNNDTNLNNFDSERSSNVCVYENSPKSSDNYSLVSSVINNELESTYTSSDETKNNINSSMDSNTCNTSKSSIHSQSSVSESSYDTCDNDQISLINITGAQKEPVVVIERINNSMFLKYYKKMLSSHNNIKSDQSSTEDINQAEKEPKVNLTKINDSILLKNNEKLLELQEESISNQSLIKGESKAANEPLVALEKMSGSLLLMCSENVLEDQIDCMSDESSIYDVNQPEKEPLITIEKMRDSLLFMYTGKVKNSQDEGMSKGINDEFDNLAYNSDKEMIDGLKDDSYDTDEIKEAAVVTDSSTTDGVVFMEEYDNEEECKGEDNRYFSFVTTRRRHEIINDSLFQFDQSYGSSSTDGNKTVVSNRVTIDKSDSTNIGNDVVTTLIDIEAKENYRNVKTDIEKTYPRIPIRKSTLSNISNSISPQINVLKSENSGRENTLEINIRKGSNISRPSNASINLVSKLRPSYTATTRINSKPRKSARKLSKSMKSPETNDENAETLKHSAKDNDTFENNPDGLENIQSVSTSPTENASYMFKENAISHPRRLSYAESEVKPAIVLQPGKKWERSLSIYRRMTMINDHFDQSILDNDCKLNKGRKYRQSVIDTMEMQEHRDSLHNVSINSRRSTFVSNPGRPTIRFVKDPNFSRVSLNTSSIFDDLKGFLSEECDDTVIELSKLSIADSEREVTILDNFHEAERVTTARDYVLRRCNQTEPILFDECYPETVLKNCHKIGEGVYGEVFLWRGRDGRARVMKIVPIAGTVKVNGEQQKDFHEIISEIVIAMELSALRAPIADIERQLDEGHDIDAVELHAIENGTDIFNEVLAVRCVYGPYPSRLLDLWELYDECKGSENDNPAALPTDQRYIVLELANAGQDLESYQFASAQQAHALFQQIAFGLAVAEEAFQFEHRDLHWGNVLIAPTEQKFATFVLRGRTHRVLRRGVAATIIDYSLSRLSLPLAADCAALYNDLATDEQLFDAVGDYQFEVYRLMREKLGNDWKNFEPYTNILWLHYIVDKMITALRYKRTNTKIHKHYIEKLKGIKNSILEYGSAAQYVLTDIDF